MFKQTACIPSYPATLSLFIVIITVCDSWAGSDSSSCVCCLLCVCREAELATLKKALEMARYDLVRTTKPMQSYADS
jgi:hypothetical protein